MFVLAIRFRILSIAMSISILSACGWNSKPRGSIFPEYVYDTTFDVRRNNEFISFIIDQAHSLALPEPDIQQFPGFNTTHIYIETEDFLIIIENSVERMDHRTDMYCSFMECDLEEPELTTYDAAFYCNYKECDLVELEALAQRIRGPLSSKFQTSELSQMSIE